MSRPLKPVSRSECDISPLAPWRGPAINQMKFLQVHSHSDEYLRDLSLRHPEMEVTTYGATMRILHEDGQSAAHLIASHLDAEEFESRLLVPNFREGLASWKRERGIRPSVTGNDLLVEYVLEFSPEILYLSSPDRTGIDLLQSLPKRPRLVIGRFSPGLPTDFDWGHFDLIVTDEAPSSVIPGRSSSIPFEHLPAGYPTRPFAPLPEVEEEIDLVFFGRSSEAHRDRNRSFLEAAKATLSQPRDFLVECHLATPHPELVPAGIAMFNQGPRFGREAHRALKRGRVCLDGFLSCDEDEFGMRQIVEGAALGSFQLIRHNDAIGRAFKVGEEIETYQSQEELLEKLFYYLDHPEARRTISDRARQRCLHSHSMEARARKFQEFVRQGLQQSPRRIDPASSSRPRAKDRSVPAKEGRRKEKSGVKKSRQDRAPKRRPDGLLQRILRRLRGMFRSPRG